VRDYSPLLAAISIPRLAGSAGNARVRALLKEELVTRGFVVMEHVFPASRRALRAVAVLGVLIALAAAGSAVLTLRPVAGGAGWAGLGLIVLTAALALRPWRHAVAVSAVNLVGVRPHTRVAAWLTAHYDGKGQPISMATRIGGVLLVLLQLPVLGLYAVAGHSPLSALAFLPGFIGGLILARNTATAHSPGALDNASGVITVLATVDALPPDCPVGIIFPDAEELGLLGARALARERANLLDGTAVVNFDGIDDREHTIPLVHRGGPAVDAVVRSLGGRPARRLPVLEDGRALARAARECVTIMRGDWRTATVVHTPGDTPARLTLAGSRAVAAAVARALAETLPVR
jgi:hypothetical protein